MTCISEDEKLKAILREITVDTKPKQFIEIWNKQHLIKSYDLSVYDVHGDVYSESKIF
jgi:acylaminoacyl-peptidase